MNYHGINENKQRGTLDFPIEFYHVDSNHPQYYMPFHWHIEYEILRVVQGKFHISLDEREYLIEPGDIVFIKDGIVHGGNPDDCIYECIVFDIKMLLRPNCACNKYIFRIAQDFISINEYIPSTVTKLNKLTNQLFDSFQEKRDGQELLIEGYLMQLIGEVYMHHLYSNNRIQDKKSNRRISQLKSVLEFITENYSSPLTLEDLSNSAGMSPKYFCQFFHDMTHKTPIDYLNYYRIERACYQLLLNDTPITEIAYNCGFNDVSYFIKTFKKYKGTTPKQYSKYYDYAQ